MANPTTKGIQERNRPKPSRIVVVEDNAGDVYLYADGEQAIRALQRDDGPVPDLVILDLDLPRREVDVLQTIRTKPSLVGVPIAILTSSDAVSDRHRIAVTGGERFLRHCDIFC